MSAQDLQRFVVLCALVSDLSCPGFSPRQSLAKDSNLARTAARYKIDLAKITAEVRAEFSTRAKQEAQRQAETQRARQTKLTPYLKGRVLGRGPLCFSGFCCRATTPASGHFLRHDHNKFPVRLGRLAQALP
jgi:hypothetical protein